MTIESMSRSSRAAFIASKEQGTLEPIDDIIVGRDVLELVSSAMYIDPMTVYREYVQNAADAIDDARRTGVLSPGQTGDVSITIDSNSRTIRIRDNGTGISNEEFARKMTTLGASAKRGTNARGFRGVGRLAGLGYAQEVIFRSRAEGDQSVHELTWDCRKLKTALRQGAGDIGDLIRSVATLRKREAADHPSRFFEVEMRGVIRIRSDRLMSPAAVEEYLGQVAPVPFAPDFSFGHDIRSVLAPVVELGELNIQIEGNERPVYRPHRDVFMPDGVKTVKFDRLSISEINGMEGELAAIVWILHHDYEGALPNATGVKGLRLRCGNVQIGDHNLLEELFPEPRFNSWAVGEIHVIDRKIVPNGRRDNFDQNAHYHNLVNQLTPAAREITRLCRTNSIRRNWLRDIEVQKQSVNQIIDLLEQAVISADEQAKYVSKGADCFGRLEKALQRKIVSDQEIAEMSAEIALLRSRFELVGNAADTPSSLAMLGEQDRRSFSRFCELLYECAPNQASAKVLVDKMLARLSGS
ncbi:molecular chaperone HtpG [Sinorhizobium kostiense]|uniref:Molecular chaperone HtpG n=1 Tax=Sinorhizobium kostiense TaxID=76747 RepID=A0ABS4R461_9HYPH|nr:ATP-binding protein [Sinorhizobium kostiense]MBP2237672.1 molecular chaperone HtpG [Sinorhizobium kostiense]